MDIDFVVTKLTDSNYLIVDMSVPPERPIVNFTREAGDKFLNDKMDEYGRPLNIYLLDFTKTKTNES